MKSKQTYRQLCIWLGWCGAHKFYINQYKAGFIYMFTFGLLFMGWIKDLFFAGEVVDRYNVTRGYLNMTARDGRGKDS